MYNPRIFCILFTIAFVIGITCNSAEAEEAISVATGNEIYYKGDHIVVFGNVSTVFEDLPITIQIYYESTLIDVAQVPIAKDGSFGQSFSATGPQWKDDGTYMIRVFYTPTQVAETTFDYFDQIIDKSSAAFPVDIPNSGSFNVGYTIRGGEINEITMDNDRHSILIDVTMNSGGNVVLKLPTESFDAESDDANADFIVLISKDTGMAPENFVQVEYEEIGTSDDYRTIRIPIEEGDKLIEVIGTYIIPEFGTIVIMILLIAITSTVILSKSRFSVRYN